MFDKHFATLDDFFNDESCKEKAALWMKSDPVPHFDVESFLAMACRSDAPAEACGFTSMEAKFDIIDGKRSAPRYAEGYLPLGAVYIPAHSKGPPTALDDAIAIGFNDKKSSWHPALFIDRDGIIIKDTGYPIEPSKVEFILETQELMKQAAQYGFKIVVVTNQSGLARGIFSDSQYTAFERYLDDELRKAGVRIEKWYHCPFHIDGSVAKYSRYSLFRKPNPGMLLSACNDLGLSVTKSIMIGDKPSDRIAPFKSYVVGTGEDCDFEDIRTLRENLFKTDN